MLARAGTLIFLNILVSRGVAVGFQDIGFWIEVCERSLVPLSSQLAEEKKLTLWCGFNKLLELARAVATFIWRHVCNCFWENQSRGRRFLGKSSRAPFFERASCLPAAEGAAPQLALEPEVAIVIGGVLLHLLWTG
jgi:hypothetical protein